MRLWRKSGDPALRSSSGSLHSQRSANSIAHTSFNVDPDDFIILVMGPTGSGKTNFVNRLTGNSENPTASHLTSDTQGITPYPIDGEDPSGRLVLVDTPGFDDTHRPDAVILRVIADWLVQRYPDGTMLKIAGIIYFHRINDNRLSGSAVKNLRMFSGICGSGFLRRTILVTTMWDTINDEALAAQRERELEDVFWSELIEGGATVRQFRNTADSAREIINDFLCMGKGDDTLLLQEELAEHGKRLNETEAGKALHNRIQKLLSDQKQALEALAQEAKDKNDETAVQKLRKDCDKIDVELQKTFVEMNEMKLPLPRRIYLLFSGRKARAKIADSDYM